MLTSLLCPQPQKAQQAHPIPTQVDFLGPVAESTDVLGLAPLTIEDTPSAPNTPKAACAVSV